MFIFGHVRFITEASQNFVKAFTIKCKHVLVSVGSIVQLGETIENHEVAVQHTVLLSVPQNAVCKMLQKKVIEIKPSKRVYFLVIVYSIFCKYL